MKTARPKNLNLFTIRFPIPAIVSILHRVSGVFLFLLIPVLLWALDTSLTDSGFQDIQNWLSTPSIKVIFWLFLAAFYFHLVAGIRHLLSDIHIGDSLKAGRLGAMLTFVVTAILVVLTGIWLW